MGISVIGTLKFLILNRKELTEYGKKHSANLNAALRDALPLIEKLRQSAFSESESAQKVQEVVSKAEELTRYNDTTNPAPGYASRDA